MDHSQGRHVERRDSFDLTQGNVNEPPLHLDLRTGREMQVDEDSSSSTSNSSSSDSSSSDSSSSDSSSSDSSSSDSSSSDSSSSDSSSSDSSSSNTSTSVTLSQIKYEMCLREDMIIPLSPLPPSPPPQSSPLLDASPKIAPLEEIFSDVTLCGDSEIPKKSKKVISMSYCEKITYSERNNEHFCSTDECSSDSCEGSVSCHEKVRYSERNNERFCATDQCSSDLGKRSVSCHEKLMYSESNIEHSCATDQCSLDLCEGTVSGHEKFDQPSECSLATSNNFVDSDAVNNHSEKSDLPSHEEGERTINAVEECVKLFTATLDYDDKTQSSSFYIDALSEVPVLFQNYDNGTTLHLRWPDTRHVEFPKSPFYATPETKEKRKEMSDALKCAVSPGKPSELNSVPIQTIVTSDSYQGSKTFDQPSECSLQAFDNFMDSNALNTHSERSDWSSQGDGERYCNVPKESDKLFAATLDYDDKTKSFLLYVDALRKVLVSFVAYNNGTFNYNWPDPQSKEFTGSSSYSMVFSQEKRKTRKKIINAVKYIVSPGESVELNMTPVANKSSFIEPSKELQSKEMVCADSLQITSKKTSNLYDEQQLSGQPLASQNGSSDGKLTSAAKGSSKMIKFNAPLHKANLSDVGGNILRSDHCFQNPPNVSTVNALLSNTALPCSKDEMQPAKCDKQYSRARLMHQKSEKVQLDKAHFPASKPLFIEPSKELQSKEMVCADSLQITSKKTSNLYDEQQLSGQLLTSQNGSSDGKLTSAAKGSSKMTRFNAPLHEANLSDVVGNTLQSNGCFQNPPNVSTVNALLSNTALPCSKDEMQPAKRDKQYNRTKFMHQKSEKVQPEKSHFPASKPLFIEPSKELQSKEMVCADSLQITSKKTSNLYDEQQLSGQLLTSRNGSSDGKLTSAAKGSSKVIKFNAPLHKANLSDVGGNTLQSDQCFQNPPNVSTVNALLSNTALPCSKDEMQPAKHKQYSRAKLMHQKSEKVQPEKSHFPASKPLFIEPSKERQSKEMVCADSLQITSKKTSNLYDEQQLSGQLLTSQNGSSDGKLTSAAKGSSKMTRFNAPLHEANLTDVVGNTLQSDQCFQNPPNVGTVHALSNTALPCSKDIMQPAKRDKHYIRTKLMRQKSDKVQSDKSHFANSLKTGPCLYDQQQTSEHLLAGEHHRSSFADDKVANATKIPSEVTEFSSVVHATNATNVEQNDQCFQNFLHVSPVEALLPSTVHPHVNSEVHALKSNKQHSSIKLLSQKSKNKVLPKKTHFADSLKMSNFICDLPQPTGQLVAFKNGSSLACAGLTSVTKRPSEMTEFSADVPETNSACSERNVEQNDQYSQIGRSRLKEGTQAPKCNKQQNATKLLSQKSKKKVQPEKACFVGSFQIQPAKTSNLYDQQHPSEKLFVGNNRSAVANNKQQNATKLLSQKSEKKVQPKKARFVDSFQIQPAKTSNLYDQQHPSEKLLFPGNNRSSVVNNEQQNATRLLPQKSKKKAQPEKACVVDSFQIQPAKTSNLYDQQHPSEKLFVGNNRSAVANNKQQNATKLLLQKSEKKVQPKKARFVDSFQIQPAKTSNLYDQQHPSEKLLFPGNNGSSVVNNKQQNATKLLPQKSKKKAQPEKACVVDSFQIQPAKTSNLSDQQHPSEQLLFAGNNRSSVVNNKPSATEGPVEGTKTNSVYLEEKMVHDGSFQGISDVSRVDDILPSTESETKNSVTAGVKRKLTRSTKFSENLGFCSTGNDICFEQLSKKQKLNGNNYEQRYESQQNIEGKHTSSPCHGNVGKNTTSTDIRKGRDFSAVEDLNVSSNPVPNKCLIADKGCTSLVNDEVKHANAAEKLNDTVSSGFSKGSVHNRKKWRKRKENSSAPSAQNADLVENKNSWRYHFFLLGRDTNLKCNAALKKCLEKLEEVNTSERFHNVLTNRFMCTILNPAVVVDVEQAASTIIDYVVSSKHDPVENLVINQSGTITVPLMPLSEQYLVKCLFDLKEKDKPHMRGIIPAVLSMILGHFFWSSLNHQGLAALCRLYTAIYQRLGFLPAPQLLCHDILLKCRSRFTTYLIASVVGVWPKVLDFQGIFQGEQNPLNLAMSFLLTRRIVQYGSLRENALKVLFSLTSLNFHGISGLTSADLVKKIFHNFAQYVEKGSFTTEQMTQYTKAIELLCGNLGWKYAYDVVLMECVYPFLDTWVKKHRGAHNIGNNKAVTAVFHLLGYLYRLTLKCNAEAASSIINMLQAILVESAVQEIPFVVQEAAYETLLSLKSDVKDLVLPAVQSWEQKNTGLMNSYSQKLLKTSQCFPQSSDDFSRHNNLDTCSHCVISSWWSHYCVIK